MHLFNLTLYKPTDLEIRISNIYRENGILSASDLDLDVIASLFDAYIVYADGNTKVIFDDDGDCLMFLNIHDNEPEQREDFFHELGHLTRHVGNQRKLPPSFVDLQEAQATLFQMYSAMPAYMLEEFNVNQYQSNYLKVLSEAFRLTQELVNRRIDQIYGRIKQERYDRNLRARTTPRPTIYSYSDSTMKILDQLNRQVAERKV
ncbi:ImmA/IrrE family metallo-endopeptidase [Bacillus sp. FJAT-28004]|uniref:ImmA/IrrE family metallo-endopeptidase n=1 Tax=Bacillus sp. FJAT-28004 TaxID=1679165 RepID=UPI0006B57003|nr:ImmA/IrrE family metallo-endopeptidase [Bacillus sp. FJAT-28004]